MIDNAAEMSTSGLVLSRYSATSWDRNSYETVVRFGGNTSSSPRRISMLPERDRQRAYNGAWLEREITDRYE